MAKPIMDRILELRRVPAKSLLPNPRNWRQHPKAQRDALKGVLQEIGFADALLARETPDGLTLIDGHLRQELLSHQELPVLIVDLSQEEADKLLATLDPLAAMASPDQDRLLSLLRDVSFESKAVNDMLEALANGETQPMPNKAGLTDPDDVPDPSAEPWVKTGDLFQLGEHKVLCGDSTKAEDVERLLDGEKAQMVFTDPPYSVGIGAKNRALYAVSGKSGRHTEDMVGDTLSVGATAEQIWGPAFRGAHTATDKDASMYVTMPQGGEQMLMMMMMMGEHWLVKHELIWVKNQPTFSIGRLDYDYQHEPIAYGWKKGASHRWFGKGAFTKSIWMIDKPRESKVHPTMKPVALVVNAISNSLAMHDALYDPFLGSGTTLIACETLDRVCYGMEILPHYVQVSIERWEQYTGQKALLVEGDG